MKRRLAVCLVMLALLPTFALAAPVAAEANPVVSAGIAGYDRLYEDMSVVLACEAYEHKVYAVTPDNDGTYRFLAYIREATETNRAQMTFCVYDTDGNCLFRSAPEMRVQDLSLRAETVYISIFVLCAATWNPSRRTSFSVRFRLCPPHAFFWMRQAALSRARISCCRTVLSTRSRN